MKVRLFRMTTVLLVLALLSDVSAYDVDNDLGPNILYRNMPKLVPYVADEEYIRHIHSMINAYRGDRLGGKLVIETNALIDTKYRTWKRNADLINSLLALPKGMNDAGR
ncbi:hypothetical protein K1T71_003881 [Dendrolimus kikuchii]|uniref:Uncharacterized protein n=1 Tax=Dendrolimus kikuchii TaxID=765133 RepID=A0ACC1DA75_9NEOP|nr:hypothetical protein K1T71_003881 [Dendrolimus kikuchii]